MEAEMRREREMVAEEGGMTVEDVLRHSSRDTACRAYVMQPSNGCSSGTDATKSGCAAVRSGVHRNRQQRVREHVMRYMIHVGNAGALHY
jgi:hypothetical protein